MGRLFLLLLVAVALAPGTWLREDLSARPVDERQRLAFTPLDVPGEVDLGEELEVAGAWELASTNFHFAGFSALLAMGDGTLLAASDHRREMRFTPPGAPSPSVRFAFFEPYEPNLQRMIDLEALARDPASGTIWGAYERTNQIERYEPGRAAVLATPPAMRGWPANGGPEALARLADGRFVVLAEGTPRWFASALPGLLYPGDPVDGAAPARFLFEPPDGFVPVDMAPIPDGRVLILLRGVRWGLPPTFESRLAVADPREIRPGEPWRWRELASLAEPLPMDNYEGLAVEPGEDGKLVLWLISDDNRSKFQRTLLLKLLWSNEKARGNRAPR